MSSSKAESITSDVSQPAPTSQSPPIAKQLLSPPSPLVESTSINKEDDKEVLGETITSFSSSSSSTLSSVTYSSTSAPPAPLTLTKEQEEAAEKRRKTLAALNAKFKNKNAPPSTSTSITSPSTTEKDKDKKKRRARCTTCPGCLSDGCGTCTTCTNSSSKTMCKARKCWSIVYDLPQGVGGDGRVYYCVRCGPRDESSESGESGESSDEDVKEKVEKVKRVKVKKVGIVGVGDDKDDEDVKMPADDSDGDDGDDGSYDKAEENEQYATGSTLIVCEKCPRGYHLRCLQSQSSPPPSPSSIVTNDADKEKTFEVPPGDWFCDQCKEKSGKDESESKKKSKQSTPAKPSAKPPAKAPSLSAKASEASPKKPQDKVKKIRRVRCQKCTGCLSKGCGVCASCTNPEAKSMCKMKQCVVLLAEPASCSVAVAEAGAGAGDEGEDNANANEDGKDSKVKKTRRARCGKCNGCLSAGCGACDACTNPESKRLCKGRNCEVLLKDKPPRASANSKGGGVKRKSTSSSSSASTSASTSASASAIEPSAPKKKRAPNKIPPKPKLPPIESTVDPNTFTNLEAVQRNPNFIAVVNFLVLTSKVLKFKVSSPAESIYFPVGDLEKGLARGGSNDDDGDDDDDDVYDNDNGDDDYSSGGKHVQRYILNQIFTCLTNSASERLKYKAEGDPLQEGGRKGWGVKLKSKLLRLFGTIDIIKGEIKRRRDKEVRVQKIKKWKETGIVKRINKNEDTCTAFFEKDESTEHDLPIVDDEGNRVMKVGDGYVLEFEKVEDSDDSNSDDEKENDDDDEDGENEDESADMAEDSDSSASASGDGDGDVDEEGEKEKPKNSHSLKKKVETGRSMADKDAAILALAEKGGGGGGESALLTQETLSFVLMSPDHKVITNLVDFAIQRMDFEKLEKLLSQNSCLVRDITLDEITPYLISSSSTISSLPPTLRVTILTLLCESLSDTDTLIQKDMRSSQVEDLRYKPVGIDAYGREYWYFHIAQDLCGCRIYRTIYSMDRQERDDPLLEGQGKYLTVNVEGVDEKGVNIDKRNYWEVVVNSEGDLERIIKDSSLYLDKKNKEGGETLKGLFEGLLEDLVLEKEQHSSRQQRERKKEQLRAMPRKRSSRIAGGDDDDGFLLRGL